VLIIIPLAIWFVVHIEEPDLEQRFGEEYRNYKKTTPRWGWRF
jgi:protein-S-isoprenylcysteine O-methyltransferase Ste14